MFAARVSWLACCQCRAEIEALNYDTINGDAQVELGVCCVNFRNKKALSLDSTDDGVCASVEQKERSREWRTVFEHFDAHSDNGGNGCQKVHREPLNRERLTHGVSRPNGDRIDNAAYAVVGKKALNARGGDGCTSTELEQKGSDGRRGRWSCRSCPACPACRTCRSDRARSSTRTARACARALIRFATATFF